MKKVFFSIMTALCGLIMNAAFVQAEMTLRENIEDKVLETVREQENIPSKAIAIFKTNHLLNQRKYHSVSVVCNAILRNYKEQDAESGNVEIVFDTRCFDKIEEYSYTNKLKFSLELESFQEKNSKNQAVTSLEINGKMLDWKKAIQLRKIKNKDGIVVMYVFNMPITDKSMLTALKLFFKQSGPIANKNIFKKIYNLPEPYTVFNID